MFAGGGGRPACKRTTLSQQVDAKKRTGFGATMILDVIENSLGKEKISMGEEIGYYTEKLRQFMFERVYLNSAAKREEGKAKYIIEELYYYYLDNYDMLPEEHKNLYRENIFSKEDIICDYIAGMTDRYAVNLFKDLFIPKAWEKY